MKSNLLSRSKAADLAICLFLFIAVMMLYGSVVNLWWMNDDPAILKLALQHSPWQYFFVPKIYRELSIANFTPLVMLSYGVDSALFGLNPKMFYLHHLLMLWLCTGMLYMLLRGWCSRLVSLAGVSFFLLGLPLVTISQDLMTRHYVEGLFFSLLSVYFFRKGLRENKRGWVFWSAFFYMAAMTAKEVYVPLVFLLLALPEKDWKLRFNYCLPLFIVFLVFMLWRSWMLGFSVGGYSGMTGFPAFSAVLAMFPKRVFSLLFEIKSLSDKIVLIVLSLLVLYFLLRNHRAAVFVLWCGLLTVLPVLFVFSSLIFVLPSIAIVPRYLLVIWVVCSLLLASALQYFRNGGLATRMASIILIVGTMVLFFQHNREAWGRNLEISKQKSVEGRFFLLGMRKGDVIRNPVADFEGISLLSVYYPVSAADKRWFSDDMYLCENKIEGKRIWSYFPAGNVMTDITPTVPAIRMAYCGRVRQDADLRVNVDYVNPTLTWQFGPYEKGEYAFVLDTAQAKYPVPRSGTWRTALSASPEFRVRYESTDGWITYSPVLSLSGEANHMAIKWERGRDAKD